MPYGKAAKRRSRLSGEKVDYKTWLRWRRLIKWIRRRHGISGGQISKRLRANPGFVDQTLKYPYNLRPREYEATRDLLRALSKGKVDMPPGKGVPRARSVSQDDVKRAFRILETFKSRGFQLNDIAREMGWAVNSIHTFRHTFRDPNKRAGISPEAFGRLMQIGKAKLPRALMEELLDPVDIAVLYNGTRPALSEGEADRLDARKIDALAEHSNTPLSLGEEIPAAREPRPATAKRSSRQKSSGNVFSQFNAALEKVKDAEAALLELEAGLPPFLAEMFHKEVTDWITQGRERLESNLNKQSNNA